MKHKSIFILLILLFLISACSGGGWTKASGNASKCDDGKAVEVWMEKLVVEPKDGDTATVWKSYNGDGCGEKVGKVAAGKEIEWAQIVENASGDMLVNVRTADLPESGWINCADISFKGDMEAVLGALSDEGDDLYVACVNISKQ